MTTATKPAAQAGYKKQEEFQAPIKYEPPTTVLTRLGIVEDRQQAFVFAQAAMMKVDPGHLDIPENIAQIVKSVQYTRQYGFMPGIHLHMTPFNTKVKRKKPDGNTVEVWETRFELVVGEQAYKAAARIQANREGDHIEFEWEALAPDALAAYVSENMSKDFVSTDEDRGVRARVLSLKGAQIAQVMGRKYDPEWSYGFCFMKGAPRVYDGKTSFPKSDRERVPNQRTALDVAIRRAVKSAIMKQYHLVPIDGRTEDQRVEDVLLTAAQEEAHEAERNTPFAQKPDLREQDGDVLFYGEPSHRNGAQAQADDDGVTDGEFATTPEPLDILADPSVHDALKDFVRKFRTEERPGVRPATAAQTGFAFGLVDKICGKDSHDPVMRILFGREVTVDAPPAEAAAKIMFDHFKPTKKVKDESDPDGRRTTEIDNPAYDAGMVDMMREVGKWALTQKVPA